MNFYNFLSTMTLLSSVLNGVAKAQALSKFLPVNETQELSLPYGGVGLSAHGVHIGPIYNYHAAHNEGAVKNSPEKAFPIVNNQTIWKEPSSNQQLVIYSCSSTTCGLSVGYDDVNSDATYVPIGFGMADENGNVDFTATAPVSELKGRGGISYGGAGQYHPEYFLNDVDIVAPQMVALAKANNVDKIDIDLEQISSIAPSYMTDLLTTIHDLAPDITLSVAPECPGVSSSAGAYVPGSGSVYNYWVEILNECPFLIVFIQSYNNWCSPYAYGSYENLMQILSDWINPNAAINYKGYNSGQIVLGLCAIEPEKDPTACSFGYATADVVKQTFLAANDLYGCTVGGGVWASYCDKANNYLITTTIQSAFDECSGQTSAPTVALTSSPTKAPSTAAPTQTPSSISPTVMQSATPTSSAVPSVAPTQAPTTNKSSSGESSINSKTIEAAAVGLGIGVVMSAVGYFAYNKYRASKQERYMSVSSEC